MMISRRPTDQQPHQTPPPAAPTSGMGTAQMSPVSTGSVCATSREGNHPAIHHTQAVISETSTMPSPISALIDTGRCRKIPAHAIPP